MSQKPVKRLAERSDKPARADDSLERQNEALRQAQVQLAESRDRLGELYEFAPVGYLSFDQHSVIHECNHAAATLLGINRNQLIGTRLSAFVAPTQQDAFYRHRRAVVANPGKTSLELAMRKADGTALHIRLESLAHSSQVPLVNGVPAQNCLCALIDMTEFQHAAQQLAQCAERNQRLLASTIDYIAHVRVEAGRAVETERSPGCLAVTGYSAAELAAAPDLWKQMIVEEDRATVLQRRKRLLAGADIEPYEHRIRRKDGELRWLESTVITQRDAHGKLIAYDSLLRDVTRRKQAESLTHCQNQSLEMVVQGRSMLAVLNYLCRTIENQLQQGVIACIHLLNEAGTAFEYTAAPSLPERYTRAINGVPVSAALGPCCRAVATRQTVVVPDIAADSQWADFCGFALPLGVRACWSTPIFSADQKIVATFANYYREPRDPRPGDQQLVDLVTRTTTLVIERVQAEQALRDLNQTLERRVTERTAELSSLLLTLAEKDERLRLALDACVMGTWDFDPNTERLHADDQHCRIYGRKSPYRSYDEWLACVHPEDRSRLADETQRALQGAESVAGSEYRILRPDGSVRWLAGWSKAYFDAQGKPARFTGVEIDISERKAPEEEILRIADAERCRIGLELHDDVQQRLVGLSLMAGNLKHDLASKPAAQAGLLADRIADTALRVRLLSRGLTSSLEVLEGNSLVAALKQLARSVGVKGQMSCRFKCDGPVEFEDRLVANHLYRIAQEALTNAIRHSRASRITLCLAQAGGMTRLRVTDNGQGIEQAQGGGTGLKLMAYRASLIGAGLKIARARRQGTEVICTLSVPELCGGSE